MIPREDVLGKELDLEVERTIYPVGHGTFCCEIIKPLSADKEFVMVYDCGAKTSAGKEAIREYVEADFEGKKIDLLCISHFDQDHISGLWSLEPCITSETIVLIPFFESILEVLENGTPYMRGYEEVREWLAKNECKCVMVKGVDGLDYGDKMIEDLNDGDIVGTGQRLICGKQLEYLWCYRPFNVRDNAVVSDFFERVEKDEKGLFKGQENLKEDICSNRILLRKVDVQKLINQLKPYYQETPKGDKVSGINMSSLLVQSAPVGMSLDIERMDTDEKRCGQHMVVKEFQMSTMSCSALYTGDVSLKDSFVQKYINEHQKEISSWLVQVPHHGAETCYDKDTLNKLGEHVFFVTTDPEARSVHLAKNLVQDIRDNGKVLYIVSNDKQSLYHKKIRVKIL